MYAARERMTPTRAELLRDAKPRVSSDGGVRSWGWASFVEVGKRRSDASSGGGSGISSEVSSLSGVVDDGMKMSFGAVFWRRSVRRRIRFRVLAVSFRRGVLVRGPAGLVLGCRRAGPLLG